MSRYRHSSRPKRTLSPEQLQKMKEGRERAQQERERQKERSQMLSELEDQLDKGRREMSNNRTVRVHRRRRRLY